MKIKMKLMFLAVAMAIILAAGSVSAATMSASSTAPAINGYDIANYGDVTGTDKWFSEDSAAGAVKGQTFITGSDNVVLNSITYQVTDTQQAEAIKTYVIRVGTFTGDIFTEIYREEATQDFMWNGGEYMTWSFDLPVLLNAGSEYGIDVGMTVSTSDWTTGIPYINMTADEYADGLRYTSGTSGIGTDTIALDGSKDRIFHLDMSSPGITVIYPMNGELVPIGDVTLLWETIDDPCNPGSPVSVDVWFGTELITDPNNPGDFTKVASDLEVSSWTVSPSGPGIYYWQVIPDIAGPNGLPVPTAVYMFTNDASIASVDVGPDMITWSGQSVDMIADVNDDGGSPLTYAWTAGSLPAGVTVDFDPSTDVANPSVSVTKAPYSNADIANAGFEADQQAEDGWGGSPGWTQIVRMGNWNPTATAYTDSAVPEGVMCAWAQGNDGGLSQVLTETLTSDAQYELTVQVGNSNAYDWTGYKVQLLAGGTVIAEDNDTLDPALGTFEMSTVIYTYTPEDANKVGLPLEIRLLAGGLATGYAEVNFDDVQLTADPAFPVSDTVTSVDVTLTVNDETNPAVADTMTIDIYANACDAAREGLGMDVVTDYNGNCVVSTDDLQIMAAAWLDDTSQEDVIFAMADGSASTTPFIVNAGGDVISWADKTFTLAPTVEDPNFPQDQFEYNWTVETVEGLSVAISDPTAETPEVTITKIPGWFNVTIPNASFEAITMSPDGQMKWFKTSENTWRFADPDGTAYTDANNKGYFGQLFLWNPKIDLGGGWNRGGLGGEVPDGQNCVIVGSKLRNSETNDDSSKEDAATNHPSGLATLLEDIYHPEGSYELTVKIGRSSIALSEIWGGYKVELLAGGTNVDSSNQYTHKVVGGTVIGQDISTDVIALETWVTATVTVPANAANADLAGEPLQIRVTSMKIPDDPNTTYMVVDDVKLGTDVPPAVLSVNLTLTSNKAGDTATASDSLMVDVYVDGCAVVKAVDPSVIAVTDLNVDCITNLVDLAVLAEDWLLDYALIAPADKP